MRGEAQKESRRAHRDDLELAVTLFSVGCCYEAVCICEKNASALFRSSSGVRS